MAPDLRKRSVAFPLLSHHTTFLFVSRESNGISLCSSKLFDFNTIIRGFSRDFLVFSLFSFCSVPELRENEGVFDMCILLGFHWRSQY